jgi:hypothetical protein
VFLVKLLMDGTFDVFTDSPGFHSVTSKSTDLVEALWRRREPVPEAEATGGLPAPPSCTAAVRLIAPEFSTKAVTRLPGLLAARLI